MSTWVNRNASSPGRSDCSGRISCLCTSETRCGAMPARSPSAQSSATAPAWKLRPSIEACSSTDRSPGSRWSMRAASTAWMLDGSASPFSAPTATSCSRKSGLPSAVSTIRVAVRDPSAVGRRALDELMRLRVRQSVERQQRPVRQRGHPHRARLHELGPGEAEQQDRMPAREGDEVLEQVEQSRLGPVDVVDHDHERALPGHPLQQPSDGPERLLGLGGAVGQADRGQDQPRDLLVSFEQLVEPLARVVAAELPDDLGQRTVGRALAVGRAAPDHHAGLVVGLGDELSCEARLADPGRPHHRHRMAGLLGARPGRGRRGAHPAPARAPRTDSGTDGAAPCRRSPGRAAATPAPSRCGPSARAAPGAPRAPRREPGRRRSRRAGSRPPPPCPRAWPRRCRRPRRRTPTAARRRRGRPRPTPRRASWRSRPPVRAPAPR